MVLASCLPPLMGRKEKTCRESTMPLTMSPTVHRSIAETIAVCASLYALYLPRNKLLLQLLLRIWCQMNKMNIPTPIHS
ncbi:Hypothetical protein TPAS_1643 [Trichococcus pasteurii]|uniref:Uncharacterized protein n=1 Tax=Trichococcus pasteurii TaxID=43064 RepID=A0A1W1IGP9_9LACT|nr:hypothetical protein SAMN04488086_11846 [Trichococcus pasteurii]SLM51963.1 Hypothetical protein TPAS_1643 [Trichococcus pasteurii]SSB92844.1 Hypothetical protein TPAS_1643 [Trichococcus pasteurii]